MRPYKY